MEKNVAKNMVNDWASDIRGADQKFIRAVVYALDQFADKNNAPMYSLIAFVNGKEWKDKASVKGLAVGADGKAVVLRQFKAPLDRILKGALPGFKFVFKDGAVSLSKKNGKIDTDKVLALRLVAAQQDSGRNFATVRSKAFLDIFPAPVKDAPKKKSAQEVQEQIAKYLAKLHKDSGFSLAELQAMATAKPSK